MRGKAKDRLLRPSTSEVTIARTTDALTLNPILYSDLASGEINNCLFDHLVMTDARGQFVPGRLLESWEVSADGLRWMFHMTQTARWHDGAGVTAADAQFTIETILDPAVRSPRRSEFIVGGQPLRSVAVDVYTLEIRLPAPFASFLDVIAWRPIVPRHVHAGRSLEPPSPDGPWPIGSGPFRVSQWVAGDRLVLTATPGYLPRRASLDRVVWRYIPEKAADIFASGNVDYLPGVQPKERDQLADVPGTWFRHIFDGNCTAVSFRLDHPLFRDIRVRRALCLAIDRRAIVNDVLQGQGTVATSMVAPERVWHNPRLPACGYDPDKSRQLLAEAGWMPGDDGILMRDGLCFSCTLLTIAQDAAKVEAAHLMARQLADIGVRMRVQGVDAGTLVREYLEPGAFDAVLLTWVPNFDIEDMYALYHSSQGRPHGWNFGGYCNVEVDRLLDRGRSTYEFEQRRPIYDRVQELIIADAPSAYLFHTYTTDAVAGHVQIPDAPCAHGGRYLRLHEWRVNAPPGSRVGGAGHVSSRSPSRIPAEMKVERRGAHSGGQDG